MVIFFIEKILTMYKFLDLAKAGIPDRSLQLLARKRYMEINNQANSNYITGGMSLKRASEF